MKKGKNRGRIGEEYGIKQEDEKGMYCSQGKVEVKQHIKCNIKHSIKHNIKPIKKHNIK